MRTPLGRTLIGALAALAVAPATVSAAPPIWEADLGPADVGLDADDGSATLALGTFSFPFYGTTYTGGTLIRISTNGHVLLADNATEANDNSPTGNKMATKPVPRLAPYWTDLNPAAGPPEGGTVKHKFFNDDADPADDRLVITWEASSFGCLDPYPACGNKVQAQLFESGKVIYGYDGLFQKVSGIQALVGVSAGSVPIAEDPGSTDLSAVGFPFAFGKAGYELFKTQPLTVDLDQRNLVFEPTGTTGFNVDQLGEDLGVTVASTPTVGAGGSITTTVTLRNGGESAAPGAKVTGAIPGGTELVSAPGCTPGATLTCGAGDLAPGATATFTITTKANVPGTVSNAYTASTTQQGDPAPDNVASAPTTITPAGAAPDTVPGPLPGIPNVTAKAASQKLAAVRSKGIKVTLTCAAACGVEATATVDAATAKKLKRTTRTLGSASGGRETAGTATITIPLSAALKARLRTQKSLKVKLAFAISTEAGDRTTSSTVTIKR